MAFTIAVCFVVFLVGLRIGFYGQEKLFSYWTDIYTSLHDCLLRPPDDIQTSVHILTYKWRKDIRTMYPWSEWPNARIRLRESILRLQNNADIKDAYTGFLVDIRKEYLSARSDYAPKPFWRLLTVPTLEECKIPDKAHPDTLTTFF